jgi:dTDP-4-amino-4,6-dideoxygalactose transaminase
VELARYNSMILPKRKYICESYAKIFSNYGWAQLPLLKDHERETSYHLYPLRIKNITEAQRDAIMQKIFDADVAVNVHFIPVPMTSYYKSIGFKIDDYPVTYKNFSCEISLPVFIDLTEADIQIVATAVIEAVKSVVN